MARRPGPSFRALLFFGVAKAAFVGLGGWKTAQTASFLAGSESDVRHWEPWPAGPGPAVLVWRRRRL